MDIAFRDSPRSPAGGVDHTAPAAGLFRVGEHAVRSLQGLHSRFRRRRAFRGPHDPDTCTGPVVPRFSTKAVPEVPWRQLLFRSAILAAYRMVFPGGPLTSFLGVASLHGARSMNTWPGGRENLCGGGVKYATYIGSHPISICRAVECGGHQAQGRYASAPCRTQMTSRHHHGQCRSP